MTDEYVHVLADKIYTCIHTLQYGVKKNKNNHTNPLFN